MKFKAVTFIVKALTGRGCVSPVCFDLGAVRSGSALLAPPSSLPWPERSEMRPGAWGVRTSQSRTRSFQAGSLRRDTAPSVALKPGVGALLAASPPAACRWKLQDWDMYQVQVSSYLRFYVSGGLKEMTLCCCPHTTIIIIIILMSAEFSSA